MRFDAALAVIYHQVPSLARRSVVEKEEEEEE